MKPHSPARLLFVTIVLMVAGVVCVQAQQRSEESVLLEKALEALKETRAENLRLGKETHELASKVEALGESLVEANKNVSKYRDEYNALRIQTEALGLDALMKGEEGVGRNLLRAISDRRVVEEEREAMADALLELADATKHYMRTATSSNSESRAAVQVALYNAGNTIGLARNRTTNREKRALDEGKITTIEREFGVLIINLGEVDEARIGMPIKIFRKDRPVGSAIICDVRDNVSSALITKLIDDSDDVQVGDRVKVQTQKNL